MCQRDVKYGLDKLWSGCGLDGLMAIGDQEDVIGCDLLPCCWVGVTGLRCHDSMPTRACAGI